MKKLKILVACEMSGVVRRAFRDRGHNAYSCDILPSEDDSEHHLIGDVLSMRIGGMHIWDWKWDMLIGFPPCTHLSLSGARWATDHWVKMKDKPPRWHDGAEKRRLREDAVAFFRTLWEAPIEKICLENPMSVASSRIVKRSQEIQPWQFGHGERKTTWLWLKNLPPLAPTNILEGREERVWNMPPGPTRSIERSRTFEGIGKAMAEQWG